MSPDCCRRLSERNSAELSLASASLSGSGGRGGSGGPNRSASLAAASGTLAAVPIRSSGGDSRTTEDWKLEEEVTSCLQGLAEEPTWTSSTTGLGSHSRGLVSEYQADVAGRTSIYATPRSQKNLSLIHI